MFILGLAIGLFLGTCCGVFIAALCYAGSDPQSPAERIDCPMDFVNLPRHGSMLGSGAVIVMDETTDLVHVCLRAMEFI